MLRSQRMQVVLDLAERSEQRAAQALQQARAQLAQEQQKQQDLQAYLSDYETTFAQQTQPAVPELLRQRSFLGQLRKAIGQQQVLIEQAARALRHHHKLWHQAYLKKRAVMNLIERLKRDEQLQLSRKDAKRLDEWTQQAFSRRATSPENSP